MQLDDSFIKKVFLRNFVRRAADSSHNVVGLLSGHLCVLHAGFVRNALRAPDGESIGRGIFSRHMQKA
jgi:hypothetical protein